MSSLFLDTDVSLSRSWRAQILAKSPYNIADLEQILAEEVSPVCSWNLLSIAGEWEGFDPEWLRTSILRQVNRRPWLSRLGRRRVLRSREWRETRELVATIRRGAGMALNSCMPGGCSDPGDGD